MIELKTGDNLDELLLIESNSFDVIYSDILYGSGNNFKSYRDLSSNKIEVYEHYVPRIREMYRVLKSSGVIILQMDHRINHYIKCILEDQLFLFQNELVWLYRSQGFQKKKFSQKHDTILVYSKGPDFYFNLEDSRDREISPSVKKRWKKEIDQYGPIFPMKKNGKVYLNNLYSPPKSWFEIGALAAGDPERTGYDTQKPKALIKKLLIAFCPPNGYVGDFYMGSGTTAEVCKDLGLSFYGVDLNPDCILITKNRLL